MSTSFRPYPIDQLPVGFEYPSALLKIAATGDYPNIYPWWFVDADTKAGALFHSTRLSDGRNLVPFAKVDDGRGDIACFDGNDTTGNPAVFMLILDDSERSYSYVDFADWLRAAQADAVRWQE